MNSGFAKIVSCLCLSAYLVAANCPVHGQHIEEPSNFGYVSSFSNSANTSVASSASVSMVQWVPIDGPIPEVLIDLDRTAVLLEQRKEIEKNV